MAGDVLVQTVLPRPLATWVKRKADEAGLSTAAWVRKLIMEAHGELWVRAWGMHPGHRKANSAEWFARQWTSQEHMILERVGVHPDGTIEFRAFDGFAKQPGTPLFSSVLENQYSDLAYELRDGWIVLEGSNEPWTVVRKVADASADGQVVLFLKPDQAVVTTTYYAYVNVDVPLVGLATSDPPVTGGAVIWQLQTDEADHNKRLAIVEKVAPPFRLENDKGQTVGTPRPASTTGLDEVLMEAQAIARAEPARQLRLVGGRNVVLRTWPKN